MRLALLCFVIVVTLSSCACPECVCEECGDSSLTLTLTPERVAPGEQITVTTSKEVESVRVSVGGASVSAEQRSATTFTFTVPRATPAGPQDIIAEAEGAVGRAALEVFGEDIIRGEAVVVLEADLSTGAPAEVLKGLEFELIEQVDLAGDFEPCSGNLARIGIGDTPLGEALEALKALEEAGEGTVYSIDPPPVYITSKVDPPDDRALKSLSLQGRNLGAGTTIAVIDTGVNDTEDSLFGERLLPGYSAVGAANTDTADRLGHGTVVASIAAGNTVGVAKEADVLPVKICDASGQCLGSDLVEGLCWALSNAPGEANKLVLNMSLGGDTSMDITETLLGVATGRGAFITASAGNDGRNGPPHYPAAHDVAGLMAVGSAEQCVTFNRLNREAYGVGDTFEDAFARAVIRPFVLANGSTFAGEVFVSVLGEAPIEKRLFTGNATVDLEFSSTLNGANFAFTDQGGTVNLSVNGAFRRVEDFSDLNGETLGGARVTVTQTDNGGLLSLSGDVDSLAVGGQELTIGDVCAGTEPLSDWAPATYSTWGEFVDIAADIPARIKQTVPRLGTSFVAPVVASVAAVVRGSNNLSPAQLQDCLQKSATSLAPNSPEAVGAGLVNLSVEEVIKECTP